MRALFWPILGGLLIALGAGAVDIVRGWLSKRHEEHQRQLRSQQRLVHELALELYAFHKSGARVSPLAQVQGAEASARQREMNLAREQPSSVLESKEQAPRWRRWVSASNWAWMWWAFAVAAMVAIGTDAWLQRYGWGPVAELFGYECEKGRTQLTGVHCKPRP